MDYKVDSRQSERDSNMNVTSQTKKPQKPKLIVDSKLSGENKEREKSMKQGIFETITAALERCTDPSIIRVTSQQYKEQLHIGKQQAGIVLEPKEKGGQVAILQKTNPCIVVDVGQGNECTIKNISMHLTGSNEETAGGPSTQQEPAKFETRGSELCMREFFHDKPDEMYCIILLKSGILKLIECTFNLNGLANVGNRKVPCITVLDLGGSNSSKNGTRLEMIKCKMKGDELANETHTAGVVSVDADILISECHFENFKSGAIMLQAKRWNDIELTENEIMSCDTNGIYVQGKQSQPLITKNFLGFCKCTAITTNFDVQGIIVGNSFDKNEVGIEIQNNRSKVIYNSIQNQHQNGIKISSFSAIPCEPIVWLNLIEKCGYNGIETRGNKCNPDIRGNFIQLNRKAGIKLTEFAQAVIRGRRKVNIYLEEAEDARNFKLKLERLQTNKSNEQNTNEEHQYAGANGQDKKICKKRFEEKMALAINITGGWDESNQYQQRDQWLQISKLDDRKDDFAEPNVIQQNYNQGILIVEGSNAEIVGNKIDLNIKANIGLGGTGSGLTQILQNLIVGSKSEGVFVVEGEEQLFIQENWFQKNSDGLVLFNSKGTVVQNQFKENQNAAIVTLGQTSTILINNVIEGLYKEDAETGSIGVLIKDPSEPELSGNKISNNRLDVEIESKKQRRKMYKKIKDGKNVIQSNIERQGKVCTLF